MEEPMGEKVELREADVIPRLTVNATRILAALRKIVERLAGLQVFES